MKIYLNIILPSTPRSPQWSLSLRFSPPKSCTRLSSPPCTLHAQLISFFPNVITRTIFGEEYRSLSSSLCSFLHSPVTSSLLGPNIPLNTLFSNTLSLRSSLNVSDQVSHPNKTTGKIIVLYIVMFMFLDNNNKYYYYYYHYYYYYCYCCCLV